jgi:5-methylcytosine-specific restriction endonuclease McrA
VTGWGSTAADQAWTAAVLDRYGRRCALRLVGCTGAATTADHIVPRSVDASLSHVVENGQPACRPCNSKRGATPLGLVVAVDDRAFFENRPDRLGPARSKEHDPPCRYSDTDTSPT